MNRSSIRAFTPRRFGLLICTFVGVAGSLGACHYSEAQKWAQCCNAVIVDDERLNSFSGKKIIDLQRHSHFNGEGHSLESSIDSSGETQKLQNVRSIVAKYIADNPLARARDYFVGWA